MSSKSAKQRLDLLLVSRGFFESREQAQRAIMAGDVRVGDFTIDKAGTRVASDADIVLRKATRYVGRGGLKLEAGLEQFGLDPTGKVCLDIGASTGGFTDCLLQHGATKVHAIDVGHSQLHWKMRSDSRVSVREKLNARFLSKSDLGELVDICVIDVSFISLTLILPRAFELLVPSGEMVALIKPQFELGKAEVGKGGIVCDPLAHERAIEKVRVFVHELGRQWRGIIESPIRGADGNKEFLAWLRP